MINDFPLIIICCLLSYSIGKMVMMIQELQWRKLRNKIKMEKKK